MMEHVHELSGGMNGDCLPLASSVMAKRMVDVGTSSKIYALLRKPRHIVKEGVLKSDDILKASGFGSASKGEVFASAAAVVLGLDRNVCKAVACVAKIGEEGAGLKEEEEEEEKEKYIFTPWINGKSLGSALPSCFHEEPHLKDAWKLVMFELLVGNVDFHEENVFFGNVVGERNAQPRYIVLDHGYCMPSKRCEEFQFVDVFRLGDKTLGGAEGAVEFMKTVSEKMKELKELANGFFEAEAWVYLEKRKRYLEKAVQQNWTLNEVINTIYGDAVDQLEEQEEEEVQQQQQQQVPCVSQHHCPPSPVCHTGNARRRRNLQFGTTALPQQVHKKVVFTMTTTTTTTISSIVTSTTIFRRIKLEIDEIGQHGQEDDHHISRSNSNQNNSSSSHHDAIMSFITNIFSSTIF